MASPRQEPRDPTLQRVLESDHVTIDNILFEQEQVLDDFLRLTLNTYDNEAIAFKGEREVVEHLAKTMVTFDEVEQDSDVPAEGVEAAIALSVGKGACSSQYCGPFIPHQRQYSTLNSTDVDLEEGSLFNPTAVPPGSEKAWLNDTVSAVASAYHAKLGGQSTWASMQHDFKVLQGALRVKEIVEPKAKVMPEDSEYRRLELYVEACLDSETAI